jgi:hypothetical protein
MDPFRRNLLWGGLLGLLAAGLVGAFSSWLVLADVIRPPFPYRMVVLLFLVLLGSFSLAEIPLMVYAMRRLLRESRGNHLPVLGLNTVFVFFASVYGAPLTLMSGSWQWGLVLCSLAVLRFVASLLFVCESEAE